MIFYSISFFFPKEKAKEQIWSNIKARKRRQTRLKTVYPRSNLVTGLGLGNSVICKLEFCHVQHSGSVSKKNKPILPQRWWEALRGSWQPNEEKGGHQQQPEAWRTHAEQRVCAGRRAGQLLCLPQGGASQEATGGRSVTSRCPGRRTWDTRTRRFWAPPGDSIACEDLGSGTALGGVWVPNSSSGESRQGSN